MFDFFLALMYGVKLSKILYNFPEHIKKGLQRFSKIKKVFRKLKIKNSSRFARMNVTIHLKGISRHSDTFLYFSKVNRILMFMFGLQVYLRGQLFLDTPDASSLASPDAKPDVKSCLTCFSQRRPSKPGAHWQSM